MIFAISWLLLALVLIALAKLTDSNILLGIAAVMLLLMAAIKV